eukprot:scaffold792_cov205-Pinguiococcus_pyrenoidosus.AAC.1
MLAADHTLVPPGSTSIPGLYFGALSRIQGGVARWRSGLTILVVILTGVQCANQSLCHCSLFFAIIVVNVKGPVAIVPGDDALVPFAAASVSSFHSCPFTVSSASFSARVTSPC